MRVIKLLWKRIWKKPEEIKEIQCLHESWFYYNSYGKQKERWAVRQCHFCGKLEPLN